MHIQAKKTIVDWSGCPIVEVNPRKVSGVPILKGTRVQADSIVENYEGGSPVQEISENFGIPEGATELRGSAAKTPEIVKVLFDHNIPHRLRHSMPAHDVSTADEMGCSELENGELLRAAEVAGFYLISAKPAGYEARPSSSQHE
jgi:uncharacterized protein (DUF433 family)